MGKAADGPANSSFSMTLCGIGSRTRIEKVGESDGLELDFQGSPYVPPESGLRKIHAFLSNAEPFARFLNMSGFSSEPVHGKYRIQTSNNVPAGTGIATSASGFAALTLSWLQVLAGARKREWVDLYRMDPGGLALGAAQIARLGSGSACRSFHGPFVEWTSGNRILPFSKSKEKYVDFILLLETAPKAVSSSEAHERVRSSLKFACRNETTVRRILRIKEALERADEQVLSREVKREALEMHELFHTSEPPFRYLNDSSRFWLSGSWSVGTPFVDAILTADAGANVHVFLPERLAHPFEGFLKDRFPECHFLMAQEGKGAVYDCQGL
ncbi:MAG: hypothetical protein KGP28_04560 [Bdellovibrionales bacterium]|nr:hypothetical protein [Bdellovibrionales bacterium]